MPATPLTAAFTYVERLAAQMDKSRHRLRITHTAHDAIMLLHERFDVYQAVMIGRLLKRLTAQLVISPYLAKSPYVATSAGGCAQWTLNITDPVPMAICRNLVSAALANDFAHIQARGIEMPSDAIVTHDDGLQLSASASDLTAALVDRDLVVPLTDTARVLLQFGDRIARLRRTRQRSYDWLAVTVAAAGPAATV